MSESTRESLEYIERTARALLNREHPRPHRAAFLLSYHARKIEMRAAEEFPEHGWP